MRRALLISVVSLALVGGWTIAQDRGGRGGGGGMPQAPAATGPIADLANAGLKAINDNNAAYFETHLAADVVWFDEDGHAIAGKDRVLGFLKRSLLTGSKKVTMTGLRVGENWAGYQYAIEGGRKGTQTVVYKKVGNDWQISMIHGAVNAAGHM
jgi:hypothetical protein